MTPVAGADASRRRPLFGRSEVLEEVERALDEVGTPRGKAVFLVGREGTGKSVILDEATVRAESRGFQPVRARALPGELGEPFRLVRDLLAAGGAEVHGLTSGAPRASAEGAPEEAGEPAGSEDDLEHLLAPLGRPSVEGLGAALQATRVRFLERFAELARRRPVAVLVDDAHLADSGSLDFLEALAREGPPRGIAVVATIDPGPALPPRNRPAFGRWTTDAAFKAIEVRPFSSAEIAEFGTWLRDGVAPSPEDVLRWTAETEGHPQFVELLVRTASGAGRPAARDGEPAEDLTAALLARARALDEVDRRVLTYASVLGREFDFARLRATVDLAEERLSEAVDRLVRGGILRERGGEVYEFASEEFRASLYSGVTETRRAILHRRVARALEARGGTSDFELARHYYLGRDDPKAIEYGVRAAEQAAAAYAFDAALSLLRQALEAEGRLPKRDPRLEVRLRTEAGRLMDEAGDLAGAEQELSAAVAVARGEAEFDLPLGRALLGLAWTRVERSDYAAAEPLALEAAASLERSGTPRDLFAAHRVLGTLYWRRSDLDLAERHQRAALAIAERDGTPREHGHALIDVANTLLPRGPQYVETTLELYGQAAALFAKEDDPNASARVLMNRAVLEYRIARVDDAMRDIGLALDAAERSRSPIWIGYCLLNASHWRAELGETELARQLNERADRTLEPTGDRLARQQLQMIRGIIAEKERRFDDAEREYAQSLANARWMGLKGEVTEMLFRRAHLAWVRGDPAGARLLLAEARANGLDALRSDLTGEARKLAAALESRTDLRG